MKKNICTRATRPSCIFGARSRALSDPLVSRTALVKAVTTNFSNKLLKRRLLTQCPQKLDQLCMPGWVLHHVFGKMLQTVQPDKAHTFVDYRLHDTDLGQFQRFRKLLAQQQDRSGAQHMYAAVEKLTVAGCPGQCVILCTVQRCKRPEGMTAFGQLQVSKRRRSALLRSRLLWPLRSSRSSG